MTLVTVFSTACPKLKGGNLSGFTSPARQRGKFELVASTNKIASFYQED